VSWRSGRWTAEHPLPIGVSSRAAVGDLVRAGGIVAVGATVAGATRIGGARRVGLSPSDFERALRVPVGGDVSAKAVLARVGRRFARTIKAPYEGRVLHATVDGDLYLAPIVDRWVVRATLDGTVVRSDDSVVEIEGDAWCLQGAAAYGPDAIGQLMVGVDGPNGEIAPTRVDARLARKIILAGARVSAEVITRAHACDVAGLIAGGAPPAGLRVVYGDTITATSWSTKEDRPTVLCLGGFGALPLPGDVYARFTELGSARAAIHTASARLFVFAGGPAAAPGADAPPTENVADEPPPADESADELVDSTVADER
jgi:hypothetical protein